VSPPFSLLKMGEVGGGQTQGMKYSLKIKKKSAGFEQK
jgi:hypothetical protein